MTLQLKKGKQPGPNDPCPCESGLKFKHCHNDPIKKAVCEATVREKMYHLIVAEKIKKGLICQHLIPAGEKCVDCMGPQEINVEGEQE